MFDPYVLYNIDMIMMPIYSLDFEGIGNLALCKYLHFAAHWPSLGKAGGASVSSYEAFEAS